MEGRQKRVRQIIKYIKDQRKMEIQKKKRKTKRAREFGGGRCQLNMEEERAKKR